MKRNNWAGWKKFLAFLRSKKRQNCYRVKTDHGKRLGIFKENMDKITRHSDGEHSGNVEIKQFSEITWQEFKDYNTYGNLKHKPSATAFDAPAGWGKNGTSLADWTSKGSVKPVNDQGSCRSCWAFFITGCAEERYFINWGKLTSLSARRLVDCSKENSHILC